MALQLGVHASQVVNQTHEAHGFCRLFGAVLLAALVGNNAQVDVAVVGPDGLDDKKLIGRQLDACRGRCERSGERVCGIDNGLGNESVPAEAGQNMAVGIDHLRQHHGLLAALSDHEAG